MNMLIIHNKNDGDLAYQNEKKLVQGHLWNYKNMIICFLVIVVQFLPRNKYLIKGSFRHNYFIQKIVVVIRSIINLIYSEGIIYP